MLQWAKVSEAQAQLDLIDSQIGRARIVAPFAAVVAQGDLSQSLGAPVQAGAELMTLVPEGRFRVVIRVDESDMPYVAVGQAGELAVAALPWEPLPLRVLRVTPMAQPREGRNVFDVEAELLKPPADLRPGLTGHARLQVGERPWGLGVLSAGLRQARMAWWRWWG
jgi:multidrug efflux pump subunit AcrA (membrane-fusion protein)